MKLQYFFVRILAAASLTVSPEIVLAHGGGGHGGGGAGHGFGGGGGGHAFVGGGGHAFGGFNGRSFSSGFSGPRGFFLGAGIPGVLVAVVSVDAIATFEGVVFAILMGTSSISASMGSDIRII